MSQAFGDKEFGTSRNWAKQKKENENIDEDVLRLTLEVLRAVSNTTPKN